MAGYVSCVPPRKRTEKACDQCRRRKTKCNGDMSCKSCLSAGLDCSYGVRIKQVRGPKYVAHLENKVKELEDEAQALRSSPSINSSFDDSPPLFGDHKPTDELPVQHSNWNELPLIDGGVEFESISNDAMYPVYENTSATEILGAAKAVLEGLAQNSSTAALCLKSLTPLHQSLRQTGSTPEAVQQLAFIMGESSYNVSLQQGVFPLDTMNTATDLPR